MRAGLVLATAAFAALTSLAFAQTSVDPVSLSELISEGGEVVAVDSLEGYPTFSVRMRDGAMEICRVDFKDFSDFADFRNEDPPGPIRTVCAELR